MEQIKERKKERKNWDTQELSTKCTSDKQTNKHSASLRQVPNHIPNVMISYALLSSTIDK
jgi:hypothetical protein